MINLKVKHLKVGRFYGAKDEARVVIGIRNCFHSIIGMATERDPCHGLKDTVIFKRKKYPEEGLECLVSSFVKWYRRYLKRRSIRVANQPKQGELS